VPTTTKELSVQKFDYDELERDTKGRLLSIQRDIAREKAKHEESGMEIGKAIAAAHALLVGDGGKDGKFSLWVESECGYCRRTAYNYMNAWQRFGSLGNCATVAQFEPTALYALASPSVPDAAVREAVKLADRGLRITKKAADDIKRKHTQNGHKSNGKPAIRAAAVADQVSPEQEDRSDSGAGPDREGDSRLGDPVEAAKLFARAYDLYGKLAQLHDQINRLAPYHDKEGIDIALGMAYENFLKWKRKYQS
jgi:hypothetical protein